MSIAALSRRGTGQKAPLVLLALLVAAATSCRSTPAGRLIFLLDVGPSAGPQVFARVGGEQKPVLFRTELVRAGMGGSVVPETAELTVPLELPPGVSLTRDTSVAALTNAGRSLRIRAVPVSEHAGDGPPTVRLGFLPHEVGQSLFYVLRVTKHPAPGQRERTLGPVRVPDNAVLRFAVGFEKDHSAEDPVTEFEIAAVSEELELPLYRHRLDPQEADDRWFPVEIPLTAVEGQEVSFRFRTLAADPADGSRRLHVLWADPFIVVESTYPPTAPNIILISLDTLGARHMSSYGYAHPTSPHLDAIAGQGTLFERTICHYPSTAASHMTLFTSLLPTVHGVRGVLDSLDEKVLTLPQILRRVGYMNAAVTEDGLLSSEVGFVRGFHAYWENVSDAEGLRVAGVLEGGTRGLARETLKQGLRWLRSLPPEPFFLFLHTYEVHKPYRPAKGYQELVHPTPVPDRPEHGGRAYDGEIRFLDRLLRRFMTQLDREELLGRTLVIITSDHGEAFGEHGHWGHGRRLYDEVMHVPLILLGPGVPRGHRVSARVGLIDITPTILDLAHIPLPESQVQGRSLVPYLRGDALPERPLVAEVEGGPTDPDLWAVWLGDKKAIHDIRKGTWEVYDLAKDAEEQRNRSAEAADTLADAAVILERHRRLKPAGALHSQPAPTQLPTPEVLEKLRGLGYIE